MKSPFFTLLKPGTPCGIDVFLPASTIKSNDTSSAPSLFILNSSSSARSFSVTPSFINLSVSVNACSVISCALCIFSISSDVFITLIVLIILSNSLFFNALAFAFANIFSICSHSLSVMAELSNMIFLSPF